jgi:sterol desaturase/sphingolipid hydroxylase (fatty acid hydroxylase superfamily)
MGRRRGQNRKETIMWEALEYLGLAFIPLFMALDLVARRRTFDTPKHWRARALAVSVLTIAFSIPVTLFWAWVFDGISLFDASGLGIAAGAVLGILVYELVHYWYHRAAHRSDFLWRWAHQMHHSAESIDAFGANYGHPLDVFFWSTWPSLVFFPLLGLQPEAGVLAATFVAFNAMFQHANIRTPRWLGYIIQRPESHGVHHQRGKHRSNYADLPLWDMVFGTFENPASFDEEAGFYNGASSRIGAMLLGRDVAGASPETVAETATERRAA